MADTYNIYCDESCHLENDKNKVMVLGAIQCDRNKVKEINQRIKEIKMRYGLETIVEIKWTKISEKTKDIYIDLVNYFFDDDDIKFRAVVADKVNLNHQKFNQTHDDWYYKMYFQLLHNMFTSESSYNIYIDIKDTNSHEKSNKLHNIICNDNYDFSKKIIRKVQPIRSHEVQIMQMVDVICGAIGYINNDWHLHNKPNQGKLDVIDNIMAKSNRKLTRSTLPSEPKFNIFKWESNYYV